MGAADEYEYDDGVISQAKVKEFPGYEAAKSTRNVIKLCDNMRAVNVNDQKMKFNNMRQGDREYVSDFKRRDDNQLKANKGMGIVADDESLVAIDFLSKLDPKRFTSMLTVLRNNAAINVSSYPTTLAGAYRAASTWTCDGLTLFLESIIQHLSLRRDKEKRSLRNRRENEPKKHRHQKVSNVLFAETSDTSPGIARTESRKTPAFIDRSSQ
jgi:hypothetical protein